MNPTEIARLVTCIEENLRASPAAGLAFVDARNLKSRLLSKQNHVVFGRRGAGKTSLVRPDGAATDHVNVYLNLEDYKDITFPNILIHVLAQLFLHLEKEITSRNRFWFVRPQIRKTIKEIRSTHNQLTERQFEPDKEIQEVETTSGYEQQMDANASHASVGASVKSSRTASSKTSRNLAKDKLEYLRLEMTGYKALLARVSCVLDGSPIFLIMDDLYFVQKNIQPELIDYFHRMTKGTQLFLKIATITHRSKLYRRERDSYVGVELGHDIFDVDMD